MTKEEIKQYIRNQIDSSIKRQSIINKNVFYLCYNKQYLRALKLSKITGQPVNKENFNGGGHLFSFYKNSKTFWYLHIIRDYLKENYSKEVDDQKQIIEEVLNEYEEYKYYKYW